MERITEKQLQAVVDRLNTLTGNPLDSWTKTETGLTANVGNYHLDMAYGRVGLQQMLSTGGGVLTILPGGTKRELYYQLRAYMDGLQAQKVRS